MIDRRTTDRDSETPEAPLSRKVVSAVSETRDTDELELEPLYRVIDPEALDSLFAGRKTDSGPGRGTVSFRYSGFEVTVVETGGATRIELTGENPSGGPRVCNHCGAELTGRVRSVTVFEGIDDLRQYALCEGCSDDETR